MKFGLRTPSLKKSFRARTTGRAKRAVKKTLIPGYGKKGINEIQYISYNCFAVFQNANTQIVFTGFNSKMILTCFNHVADFDASILRQLAV